MPEYDDSAFNQDQELVSPGDISDINRWLLEVDEEKDRLIHKFSGESWNREEEKWEKKNKQWINSEGVNVIEGHMDAVINKVMLLSNLNEEQIEEIAVSNILSLLADLSTNAANYNLDETKTELILTIIDNFEWAVLLRAKNAGERGLFKKIQYSVSRMYKQPEKNQGGLAPFGN